MSTVGEVKHGQQAESLAAGGGLPAHLGGSAVLVEGAGEDGAESLALWVLSATGVAGGAWVATRDRLRAEPQFARGLCNMIGERALLGSSVADSARLLAELRRCGGVDVGVPDRRASLPGAVEDLSELRQRLHEETLAEPERSGRKPAAISWQTNIDTRAVDSNADVRQLAGLAPSKAAPVVAEALEISSALRWVTERWLEATQVWARRGYLQDVMPQPAPLPTRLAVAMDWSL